MLCRDCAEDFAAVYYDYTAASVIPNCGDFSFPEIFLGFRILILSIGYSDLAPAGAGVGYPIAR